MQETTEASIQNPALKVLEALVAETCFCKLRSHCVDKSSTDCLKNHNIYAEAVLENAKLGKNK
jgi:hypothetical protein